MTGYLVTGRGEIKRRKRLTQSSQRQDTEGAETSGRGKSARMTAVQSGTGDDVKIVVLGLLLSICAGASLAQKKVAVPAAQVAEAVRSYRVANEDRIVRELVELLAI